MPLREDAEFEADDGLIVSRRCGCVFATHFRPAVSVEAMEAYTEWNRDQLHPEDDMVSVTLLLGAAGISDDVRKAASRYMMEFGPRTRASALVISATGFAASAARAMAATFYLLTKAGFPRKVFADIDTAERWLTPHFDDPAELNRGCAYLHSLAG